VALQLAEYELARTWFGWRVRPRPEAQILMGRGMGLFGQVIAAEGRGPNERRELIASLIARYDEARSATPDKRLMEPPVGYSHAERVSTGYRAALFIVALEDLCGRDNLRAALRDIIRTRASSDTGYEELRAATEFASGKDLAEMFRTWLIRPGIPDEFRARYQKFSSARLQNLQL
jgi:aminopeptidase N